MEGKAVGMPIIGRVVERYEDCTVEIVQDEITGELSVGWWHGRVEDKPSGKGKLTNGDRIRRMTDADLGAWLCKLIPADNCDDCPAARYCIRGYNGMADWLSEEADDGD